MTQPVLGLVASLGVMVVSLGFVSLFSFPTFAGWVSFFMLGLIPMQIVVVVLWEASPAFARRLSQPVKGVVLTLVTVVASLVLSPLALQLAGEGVSPPGPIPSHYVIAVVPSTFWLAIMMGGWPFTRFIRNPLASGLSVLAAAYLVTLLIFRLFFNYDFMQGASVYLASAPQGAANAITALVFYVTALAVMFLVLCFDLWPLSTIPGVMRQPVLGLVWTLVALVGAAVVMWIAVDLVGADPMSVLVRVTAPFIFGTIIVLNMLQNSLFANMAQPTKGVMNAVAAAVIGLALAGAYSLLAPALTGALASGPPEYDLEVWLANALLSVTFPLLIFHAALFGYWPLAVGSSRQ
jgi:hypothetical protein